MKNALPEMGLSSWRRTMMCIFVVALLSRVVFSVAMENGFYFYDSVAYSAAAENIVKNGGFGEGFDRAPVYPVFLAGMYAVFGQHIIWIRMVQAVLGACLAIMIAFVGRTVGGQGVGALAGMLWSIYPLGVFISGLVYPTILAAVLLAGAVLCLITRPDKELGPGRVFLGGILFGLAALTKPVALVAVAATTVWMVYWRRTHRYAIAALFLVGVAIALAPWTVRNAHVYDGIVIVEPRLVEHLPSIDDTSGEAPDPTEEGKVEAILGHPGEFVINFVREFGYFWELYPHRVEMSRPAYREELHERDARIVRKTVFGTRWTSLISILSVGPTFLFALIGVGTIWVDKAQRRTLSLLCTIILSFAVGYSFFYAKTRYRIPVEPYILMLSAYGMAQVYGMLLRPAHKGVAHSPEESEAAEASPIS